VKKTKNYEFRARDTIYRAQRSAGLSNVAIRWAMLNVKTI